MAQIVNTEVCANFEGELLKNNNMPRYLGLILDLNIPTSLRASSSKAKNKK